MTHIFAHFILPYYMARTIRFILYGLYYISHIIWFILYGQYDMAHIRWLILYGSYHIAHTKRFILYDLYYLANIILSIWNESNDMTHIYVYEQWLRNMVWDQFCLQSWFDKGLYMQSFQRDLICLQYRKSSQNHVTMISGRISLKNFFDNRKHI